MPALSATSLSFLLRDLKKTPKVVATMAQTAMARAG